MMLVMIANKMYHAIIQTKAPFVNTINSGTHPIRNRKRVLFSFQCKFLNFKEKKGSSATNK